MAPFDAIVDGMAPFDLGDGEPVARTTCLPGAAYLMRFVVLGCHRLPAGSTVREPPPISVAARWRLTYRRGDQP